jgi:phospholipid/cholesterol/gamma-HCH transport system permease protein
MKPTLQASAAVTEPSPQTLAFSGRWTIRGIGAIEHRLEALRPGSNTVVVADASGIEALDSAGAWLLQRLLLRLRAQGVQTTLQGLRPDFSKLLDAVAQQVTEQTTRPALNIPATPSRVEGVGRSTVALFEEIMALLSFVGEASIALAGCIVHPGRIRWRPILFNIRSAGFDALPIVGILAFLLGVVVAYQGADQLRMYGANIFVADLVGISMLREFAPLITAIIVAGRSGSAYAAQIGTMSVTEEVDAMRTLGAAAADGVRRRARGLRWNADGACPARRWLCRVSRPLHQGHRDDHVHGGYRQGAGIRSDHRHGRVLPGVSHPRRRRQRRSPDHAQRGAGDLPGDRRRFAVLRRVQRTGYMTCAT